MNFVKKFTLTFLPIISGTTEKVTINFLRLIIGGKIAIRYLRFFNGTLILIPISYQEDLSKLSEFLEHGHERFSDKKIQKSAKQIVAIPKQNLKPFESLGFELIHAYNIWNKSAVKMLMDYYDYRLTEDA